MKFANRMGRGVIVDGDSCHDISTASRGIFSPDPAALLGRWIELCEWAKTQTLGEGEAFEPGELGAPSPRPLQTFGIGTNYRAHAEEVGWPVSDFPLVFTKFPSCIAGPEGTVELSGPKVDWEVEVVVVIGSGGFRIPASEAWSRVAGITCGIDLSDRAVQMRPADNPQHSLGKSFPGYGPTGPFLVTPDEFEDRNDIALSCELNGETVQSSSTSDLIFPVPNLIEYLSHIVPLQPGDLIFTGTPSGVGSRRQPPRFLAPTDQLSASVAEAGSVRLTFSSSAT